MHHDTFPDPSDKQHLSPEQIYATFDHYQAGYADILEAGVFESNRSHSYDLLSSAQKQYALYTDRPKYMEWDKRDPVVHYVADKVDAAFAEDITQSTGSPQDLLKLYSRTFERYWRLTGPLHDDDLPRAYFPMRDLYRRAAAAARTIGDEESLEAWADKWSTYSHGKEEAMQEFDDEYDERGDTYARFQLDKDDDEVWEDVIHHAQHEDERKEVPRFGLKGISAQELADLAGLLRGQPKDEQFAAMTRKASTGETWNQVLRGLGDLPFARAVQRFLEVTVTPEDIKANKRERHEHAVILGGRDITAIDQMVFSQHRKVKGGRFSADPIGKEITIIEPSEALRTVDQRVLAEEEHIEIVDGIPTDMPFESRSQELIVGTRNSDRMDERTLADFYLELARVLKHGGVYIESSKPAQAGSGSFNHWKSMLARMIIDTVKDSGSTPDRMDPEKEAAMLKGLGLTKQLFKFDSGEIRVLVKEGAVKEVGWHMLQGMHAVDRLYGIEVGGTPDEPRFSRKRQTTRDTIVW